MPLSLHHMFSQKLHNVKHLVEVKPTKKISGPNSGQTGQNRVRNEVCCHFLKFGSLIYNNVFNCQ